MKRTKVESDGMVFYVVGSEDDSRIQRLAGELHRAILDTRLKNSRLNQVQGLVLTALNLLDEKETLRLRLDEVKESEGSGEDVALLEERDALKTKLEEQRGLLEEAKRAKTLAEKESREAQEEASNLRQELHSLKEEKRTKEEASLHEKEAQEEKIASLEARLDDVNRHLVELNREIEFLEAGRE